MVRCRSRGPTSISVRPGPPVGPRPPVGHGTPAPAPRPTRRCARPDLPSRSALLIMIVMSSRSRSTAAGSCPDHSPVPAAPAPPTRRALLASGLGLAGMLGLGACSSSGSGDSGTPTVIVGCYGLAYMAQQVAGDAAQVVNLAKPGAEPHDIELSVAETARVEKADVIIQIPGFQSALDDVISSRKLADKVLNVADVVTLLPAGGEEDEDEDEEAADASDTGGEEGHDAHEHGSVDPHFWNDPTMLAAVATALGAKLAALGTASKDAFAANAQRTVSALTELDTELAATYGAVPGEKVFVTSHTAFAYLAARYGLEQVGIAGIDPEVEPSPQRLLQLQQLIQERHVTTVFFEESASPKVAETLARNVGVASQSLDNLETQLDPKKDYPAVMREDAQKLVASWT